MAGFLIDPTKGETPESVAAQRAVADALAQRALSGPRNVGEGLTAVGNAIAYRALMRRAAATEAGGRAGAGDAFAALAAALGAGGADTTGAPEAPPPATPPSAAPNAGNVPIGWRLTGNPTSPPSIAASPTSSTGDNQAFIDKMMPLALDASKATGLDPRLIIAQAAQETGYGAHAPGNNYFGIKSAGVPSGQTLPTTEYAGGQPRAENASFRTYGSPQESAADYANFLKTNPRYAPLLAAKGLDAQVAALGASGYATDPNYAASVGSIARGLPVPQGAAPAGPQVAQGGPGMQQLLGVLSNPWTSAGQRAVAQALLQQQMQRSDPSYALDLATKQAQLSQLQHPKAETASEGGILYERGADGQWKPVTPAPPAGSHPFTQEDRTNFSIPPEQAGYMDAQGVPHYLGGSNISIDLTTGAGSVPLTDAGIPDPEAQARLLGNLSPATAAMVKGIASYEIDPTKATSLRGNERNQMVSLAKMYDPTYDMSQFPARSAMRKSITSGPYSQTINSANLVIQHLDALHNAIADLGNGPLPVANAVKNTYKQQTGDPSITRYNTAADAAAAELAKVFKGTGVSDVKSIEDWRRNLDINASPAQQQQAIDTAIGDLLASRLDTVRQQYESAMGKPYDFTFLTPHSSEVLKGLGIDISRLDPNSVTTQPNLTGQSGGAGAPPKAWLDGGGTAETWKYATPQQRGLFQ